MMTLQEAYAALNVPYGAGEAQVRASHQQRVAAWLPFRAHPDPAARQRTEWELGRFELALQVIAAAGFRAPPYPQQAYPAYPPPPSAAAAAIAPLPIVKKNPGMTILLGIGLIVLGVVITTVSHDAASSNGGGTYIIAYGPIVIGVIEVFRGLAGLVSRS